MPLKLRPTGLGSGIDYPMPDLLDHIAAPGCPRLGSTWDRCGVHYVQPIEAPGK